MNYLKLGMILGKRVSLSLMLNSGCWQSKRGRVFPDVFGVGLFESLCLFQVKVTDTWMPDFKKPKVIKKPTDQEVDRALDSALALLIRRNPARAQILLDEVKGRRPVDADNNSIAENDGLSSTVV